MQVSRRLLILALATMWLAPAAAEPSRLRIGLQDDPDILDPAQGTSFVGREVFAALCDKLVDVDRNLKIVPQLATEWSWSPDLKALTLKLRDGVKFHDGTMLDAEAVKFLTTGVDPNGKMARPPMPTYRYDKKDAAAIVVYLRSLAPAAKEEAAK